MRPLSTAELLDAWEVGLGKAPVDRAFALLRAAEPQLSEREIAGLSVGDRDARLLALRSAAFGDHCTGLANCPQCGAKVEATFEIGELLNLSSNGDPASLSAEPNVISFDGYEVHFRPPDSTDLRIAAGAVTVEEAREAFLQRCVTGVWKLGEQVEAAKLPLEVVLQLEAAMAKLDPQADIQLVLSCSECGDEWETLFDIGTFLLAEVDQWARRLLIEVASLGAAYGWSEEEALRLSPARRQAYLELASP